LFFLNRFYINKVITRAEQRVLSTLGKERGGNAMSLVAAALISLEERSRSVTELLKSSRKAGLTHDVAAIRLIETIIRETRAVVDRQPATAGDERDEVLHLVSMLQEVVDSFADSDVARLPAATRGTRYARAVIERAKKLIESTLEGDKAYLAVTLFTAALQKDIEHGKVGPAIFEHYQKMGSDDDAAIALIDGVVSSVKGLLQRNVGGPAMAVQVKRLEAVIDAYMHKSPPRFLPRNGRFAELAETTGMSQYFKQS